MQAKKLRNQEERIIAKNSIKFKKLDGLFEKMNDEPYALVKGEALSIFAYGDIGYRDSADIDILIPRSASEKIVSILKKEGFVNEVVDKKGNARELTRSEKIMFANSHELPPMIKRDTDAIIEIDINHDLFWGEYRGPQIDVQDMLERCISLSIYGVKVKSLCAVDAFIQVCLHHYREMNAIYTLRLKNSINTKMFQDIYCFYLKRFSGNHQELLEACRKYDVCEYVYYLLYYANLIFKNEFLNQQIVEFETEKGKELLDCYGLNESERKEWTVPFLERLDHPDVYRLIEKQLNANEKRKIDMALSIYERYL